MMRHSEFGMLEQPYFYSPYCNVHHTLALCSVVYFFVCCRCCCCFWAGYYGSCCGRLNQNQLCFHNCMRYYWIHIKIYSIKVCIFIFDLFFKNRYNILGAALKLARIWQKLRERERAIRLSRYVCERKYSHAQLIIPHDNDIYTMFTFLV